MKTLLKGMWAFMAGWVLVSGIFWTGDLIHLVNTGILPGEPLKMVAVFLYAIIGAAFIVVLMIKEAIEE